MLTAACYIRVSTDDQTEYSPDSQLKLIREYADKHNISLLEDYIFCEDGGKSGKNMQKRTEFMKLISLTKQKPKPFDVILVWKFSRFARNQEESIVLKSMLKKNDIDVISISESIPDGPFGSLIERIIEWSDEYYLINLSQEVKRGMLEKASRGEPVTPPPVGYDMVDHKYVPNADAEIVKNIFTDYLNGMGFRAIATKYSAMGVKTKRGKPIDNRCIEYILHNPVYIGKIRWSSDKRAASTRHYDSPNILIFDGNHEPIIDNKTFEEVQKRIKDQKLKYGKYQRREQPIEYMLKGLIRCSNCGATLVMSANGLSLQCHNYARGSCHKSHSITIKKANTAVIEYLQSLLVDKSIRLKIDNKSNPKPETNYQRILDNELLKLKRVTEAYQNGIDTLDEYRKNKTQINEFIKKVKAEMKQSEQQSVKNSDQSFLKKKIVSVLDIITDENQSEKVKNEALRTVISKIIYNKPNNNLELYFYS